MLKENRFKFEKTGIELLDKAVEAFVVFPFNPTYIDQLLSEINSELQYKYGTYIHHTLHHEIPDNIQLEASFGSISKYFDLETNYSNSVDTISRFECFCRFYSDDFDIDDLMIKYSGKDEERDKDTVDIFCQYAVPFYASAGEYRETIPLLVNIFPGFAQNALLWKAKK